MNDNEYTSERAVSLCRSLCCRLQALNNHTNWQGWSESGLSRSTIYGVLNQKDFAGTRTRFSTMFAMFESIGIPFERAVAEAAGEKLTLNEMQGSKRSGAAAEGVDVGRQLVSAIGVIINRKSGRVCSCYRLAQAIGRPTKQAHNLAEIIRFGRANGCFSLWKLAMIAGALEYPLSKLVALSKRWRTRSFGISNPRLYRKGMGY